MADPNIIYLIFAGLTVGFLVGALTTILFARRQPTHPPSELPSSQALKAKGYKAIATIWHDQSNRQLAVQIGKTEYVSPESIPPDTRQALINLGRSLLAWLGVADQPAPKPTPQPTVEAPAATPREMPRPIATPIAAPITPPPPPTAEQPKNGPTTMVAQIDEILQEMLAQSTLGHRGVRLLETPPDGVVVWVGLERFDGLDAVPCPEVRQIIQAAVDRWEEENTPK